MKKELNFLELNHLVNELQQLVGSRVDKIYQPAGLLIRFHKSGIGKLLLRINDKIMWLTSSKLPSEGVSGFCASLRKRLEGKKLTKLEQLGSERIVQFTLETQKETYFLIIELFSNGNIILTDEEKIILAAGKERAWKDRTIRRKETYVPPPAKKNLFELTEKDIVADESKLARLGFGKLLAREIIARGGNFNAYQSVLKEKPIPRAYSNGELSPIKLKQFEESGQLVKSFSELIDAKLSVTLEAHKKDEIEIAFEAKKAKLREVIKAQNKNVEKLEKNAVDLQRKGELIYEHYQELKEILDEINKAKAQFSLHEIKKKLKGHPKIKDVDPKTGDILIDLE